MERARALDPIAVNGALVAWVLFQSRRYDEAIREDRSVLAIQLDSAIGLWDLGFVLIAKAKPRTPSPI